MKSFIIFADKETLAEESLGGEGQGGGMEGRRRKTCPPAKHYIILLDLDCQIFFKLLTKEKDCCKSTYACLCDVQGSLIPFIAYFTVFVFMNVITILFYLFLFRLKEGLKFFIYFRDHHEYELEADTLEEKEKVRLIVRERNFIS